MNGNVLVLLMALYFSVLFCMAVWLLPRIFGG